MVKYKNMLPLFPVSIEIYGDFTETIELMAPHNPTDMETSEKVTKVFTKNLIFQYTRNYAVNVKVKSGVEAIVDEISLSNNVVGLDTIIAVEIINLRQFYLVGEVNDFVPQV